MLSFCYVDRQKSSLGSSEKSQVVHSANWKEQVHLKKELELLRRQENETMKRITFDQRMVSHRFVHRILRSIDQIKKIENLKEEIEQMNYQKFDKTTPDSEKNKEVGYSFVTSNISPRKDVSAERLTSGQLYRSVECRPIRPVTASEMQGRAWERKIGLMVKNIQRAKSASVRKVTIQSLDHKKNWKVSKGLTRE